MVKTSEDTIKVELYNRGYRNLDRTKWFDIASSLLSLFLTQPHFINSIGYTVLDFRTRNFIKWEELHKNVIVFYGLQRSMRQATRNLLFTVYRGACGKLRETFCFRQPVSELRLQQRTSRIWRDTDNGKNLISVRTVLFSKMPPTV